MRARCTYLSGGDHDANLLNGFGELIRLNSAIVVQVEILESLKKNGLLVSVTVGLLGQFLLKSSLEARQKVISLSAY